MKKKWTAVLVALCSAFATIGFASCDIASIIPDSSTLEQLETYTVDLDTSKFNPVVPYGSKFTYKGLTLIYKQELNGEQIYETTIDVMQDMIVSGGETDGVGNKQLVIEYEEHTWTVDYTVMYQVDFVAFDEVYTQYVLERDEIVEPTAPEVSGYEFAYWQTEKIPETLSGNLSIEAHYYDTSLRAPALRPIETTYDPNATLADLKEQLSLFSNKQGAWEFVEDETTLIGGAGTHEFEVRFVPATDEIKPQENRILTVEVAKKLVTFEVENTSFVYDGEGHFPDVKPSEDVALIKLNQSEPQTNAGSYQATFIVDEENYEGSVVINYAITKPNVEIELDSKTITYGETLPAVTYKVTGFDQDKLDLLNIQTTELVSNNAGVYPLTATVNNENVAWTVKEGTLTINKADLGEVVYKLSTEERSATYGDPISTVTFTESPLGTWAWKNPDDPIDKMGGEIDDGYTAMAVFTHQNPNYNVKEMPLTITNIAKRMITITVTENEYTYTGEEFTIQYAVSGMMSFNENYGNVTGIVKATNAGTYPSADVFTTLALESDYYTASIRTQLIINKANPSVSFTKDSESVAWTPSLSLESSDIELKAYGNLDGTYQWVNEAGTPYNASLSTLPIGEATPFKVRYTPTDTANYENAYLTFYVTVDKAVTEITNVKEEFTYNGSAQALSAGVNRDIENRNIITYELNGEEITTLENAGTYEITIKAAETAHYLPHEITVTVSVQQAENTWATEPTMNKTSWAYGATAGVPFAQANFGATIIRYMDRNGENETDTMPTAAGEYYAVFSVEETFNYDGIPEEKVAFEITKATVTKPTLAQSSFVYTGNLITVDVISSALYTVSENTATNVGEYTIKLTLTDSANYAWSDSDTDTTGLTFHVTQAQNEITALTITGWTYGKYNETQNSPTVTANFGAATATYTYAPVGSNDYKAEVPENAGSYNVKAIIAETNNYKGYERTFTNAFTIAQATPTVSFDKGYTVTWSETLSLSNITLDSGYTWIVNEDLDEIETKSYAVRYTPSDRNYHAVEGEFRVTVERASASLVGVQESYASTYNGNAYTLAGITASHNEEATIGYAYVLNGESVNEMKDAGTYSVTITLAQSTHYNGATATTTVVIGQEVNTQSVVTNQTKIYGATMAELTLPENDAYGSWSWQDENENTVASTALVGGKGTHTFYAVYTPEDQTNYADRRVEVTVNVSAMEIAVPTLSFSKTEIDRSVAYTASAQKPYVLVNGNEITANEYYTIVWENVDSENIGTYTVTFALKDKANYVWSGSTAEDQIVNYTIEQASNSITGLMITGWKYMQRTSANDPSIGSAKFGKDKVEYSYYASYNDALNGINAIENVAAAEVGTYYVKAEIAEEADYGNYAYTSAITSFAITQATPDVTCTLNTDTLTWHSLLTLNNGITISGNGAGAYAWQGNSGTQTLEVGGHACTVVFTPTDTKNYTTKEFNFTVTVEKALGAIAGVEETYTHTYRSTGYTLSPTKNHTEAAIKYAYEYVSFEGGRVSGENLSSLTMTDAGVYTVTITLPESTHYTEAEVITTVTINKVENKQTIGNNILEQEKTYGATVADLTLPANDAYGSWSWKNVADTSISLGDVDDYTYTAVYTPDDTTNYATREVDVAVTVLARKITLPTVPQGYAPVYNTEEQTPIAESVDYTRVIKDEDGNVVSPINAGAYTITLTLNNENFVWSDETTEIKEFTYEIAKAEVILPELSVSTLLYNGNNQAPNVIWKDTTILETDCVIENNGGTNVGSYPVKLTLKESVRNNYMWKATEDAYETSLPFAITEATATVENVTFTDNSWTYQQYDATANAHSAAATLNSGVTLTALYKYATKNENGTYTVIENFNPDTADAGTYGVKAYVEACVVDGITNYAGAESVNWVDFEIEKATVGAPTLSGVDNLTYAKDTTHTITVSPAVNGDLAKYSIAWSLTAQPSGTVYTGSAENGVITATNAGEYTVTFTLDANYAWADSTFNGTRTFTIAKADNGFANGSPTVSGATYDETNNKYVGTYNRSAFEASATAINGLFEIDYAGSLTNGLPQNYGDYTITFSVAESDNYKSFREQIELSIGKATPVASLTVNAENIAWQSSLTLGSTDIQLGGNATYNGKAVAGTFNWVTPTETWSGFEVGNTKEFTVGFYPTDTTNYNAVETLTFTISIVKAQATINGVLERYESDRLVYVEGKSYGLSDLGSITASSNNVAIGNAEFALSWTHTDPVGTETNGTGAMTKAGTYDLTISLSGVSASRYEATLGTTKVVIKQATVSFEQPNNWEIKEDEKVSTLALYEVKDSNQSVIGAWTWENEDATITDGENYTVVFTSSNPNYSNTTHTLTIRVNMLPLTIGSTQTSTVYVGGDVTITVSVTASDNTVLTYGTHYTLKYSYNNGTPVEAQANEFKVQNAGTYTVTIVLTESAKETYYWANENNATHTVTINSVTDVSVEDPTIENWTYGETPKEPTAEPNYTFVTVRYEYFDKNKTPIGKPTNTTAADDYYVRAVVDAQAPNYNGDTSDYVKFTIAQANYEDKFGDVTFTATYNPITWDFDLTLETIKDEITLGGKIGETVLAGTYVWGTNMAEALNATTHTFNVSLTVNDNYLPIEGTVEVTIGKKLIGVPTLSITDGTTTLTTGETIYNGKAWTPTVVEKNAGDSKYYSSDAASVSGTDFGTYTVTLSLNENCEWLESFNNELSFKINKATVTAELNEASKNLVYNTEEQTAGITMSVTNPAGFAPTFVENTDYELTNNTATYFNEDGYTLTVTLKNDNYQFDGGATEKTIDFAIAKATVTAKLASDKVKYTGSAAVLSVTVQTTDKKKTTLTDYTLSATETNVGKNYTLTVTLGEGEHAFANYEFEDGQSAALPYEIEKAQNAWANDETPSITASWTYGETGTLTLPALKFSNEDTVVTVSYAGAESGTITASANSTVTLEGLKAGNHYTVTISVNGSDNWEEFNPTTTLTFTIEKDETTEPTANNATETPKESLTNVTLPTFGKNEETPETVLSTEYEKPTVTFDGFDTEKSTITAKKHPASAVSVFRLLAEDGTLTLEDLETADVGVYVITATITDDNYKWPTNLPDYWYWLDDGTLQCIYIINPKPVTIISLTNGTGVDYNGAYHLPVDESLVEDNVVEQAIDMGDYTITITMSGSSDNVIDFGRDAGTYTITLSLDNTNFVWASEVQAQYIYTINKATNNVTLTVEDADDQTNGTQVVYTSSAIQPSLAGTPNVAGATWSYTGLDYNGQTVSGTLPTNVGTYIVAVSIPATDNYHAGSGTLTVQFTITQAAREAYEYKYGEVTFLDSIEAQYQSGLTLGGVAIENAATEQGTYTWKNTSQTLEVDETGTAYVMVFTPKDTNYAPIEENVTVKVTRIPVTISATKESHTVTYNSAKTYTLADLESIFGITSEGVELTITALTYNNAAVDLTSGYTIKNAGTYKVTINVADTVHYTATNCVVTLTIESIDAPVSGVDTTQTAAYAQNVYTTLSFSDATSTVNGDWSWANANKVALDENATFDTVALSGMTYYAVFTPTGDDAVNYNVTYVAVTVTVNKATVGAPTITTTGMLKYNETYTITVTPAASGDLAKYSIAWSLTAQPSGTVYTGSDENGVITATNAGTYTVTFALGDNYAWADNAFKGTRTFTIAKADNGFASGSPTVSGATYDETNKKYVGTYSGSAIEASATAINGSFEIAYAGLLTNGLPENYGDYTITFSVAESDNYNEFEKEINLSIGKATPTVDFDDVSFDWYNGVTLANAQTNGKYTLSGEATYNGEDVTGTYAWKDGTATGTVLNATTYNSFKVTFTPESANYEAVTKAITVTVNKVEVTISKTKTEETVTYNSDTTYTLASLESMFGITSEGVELTITALTYNNAAVDLTSGYTIKNAGAYEVTFNVADTAHYTATNCVVTLTIKQIELDVSTLNETRTATYGDLVSGLAKPTAYNTLGSWSWKDITENTTVGNATASGAYNTFKAVFTPTDTINYAKREVTVKVTVNKATVGAPTITKTGTLKYNETYTITVTPAASGDLAKYDVDWTVTAQPSKKTYTGKADAYGNITATNAGEYTVTFTLNDNYAWSDSTFNGTRKFTIEKADNAWKSTNTDNTYGISWTYDGTYHSEKIKVEADYGTVTQNIKPINAGNNYEVVFSVAEGDNYTGLTGNNARKYTVTIGKANLTLSVTQSADGYYYQNQLTAADLFGENNQGGGIVTVVRKDSTVAVSGTFSNYSGLTFVNEGDGVSETSYFTVTFTPTDTQNYNTWTNAEDNKITITLKGVAYIGSTYYGTIESAAIAANALAAQGKETSVYVIPDLNEAIDIINTITLNENVSLYVPFNGTSWDISSDDEIESLPIAYSDADATSVFNNRATLINLKNGADIVIESGASLYLGGEFNRQGVSGRYCEINLDTGSFIDVSGTFYCYGYVKENVSTAKNGNQNTYKNYYGNSFDEGRLIKVNSGGYLKTAIAIYAMPSVSNLYTLNDNNIFPLNIFDFPNLQTYVSITSGAEFVSQVHLRATTSTIGYNISEEIPVVCSNLSKASLFYLTSGTIDLEYCPNNIEYTSETALTRIIINGDLQQGTLSLTVAGETVNTAGKFLPISYKLNIYLNEEANFFTNHQIKFLPGSILKNNGGELNINSSVIFYETSMSSSILGYPTGRADAALINNGSIVVGSNGAIGAFIQTEATDTSASVDFTACADSTAFTVTSNEGLVIVGINRTSEGYFDNDSGTALYQFVAGSIITSSSSGNQCWTGEKYATRTLDVVIADTAFTHNIFAYQIYVADDASGTNSAEITSGTTIVAGSHTIVDGKYVKIAASRYAEATLDGETLDPNQWYLVSNDMELIITPNEGVKITLTTDTESGNGTTTYTITESSTETGTFVQVGSKQGIGDGSSSSPAWEIYIVKDWYFKITYAEEGLGTTKVDKGTINTGPTTGTFNTKTAYQATTEYSIHFARKECIAAGTLITLADGTQKAVENLTLEDVLLVFNHETGEYEAAGIIFIENDGWKEYNVINLKFSDGTLTRLIYEHAYFDLTLNKYVYITESNYSEFVGHEFAILSGDSYEAVTLTEAYVTTEYTGCYSLVTVYHLNYFVDGLFSIPGGIEGMFNIFEYGEGLVYDEVQMQADIEKYGLYTYEDFAGYLPYEVYAAFPAPYLKVAVGKGMITFEEILGYIEKYLEGNGVI